jgi:hypothetical protein
MQVLRLAGLSVMTAASCAALLAAACAPRMAGPIPSLHVGPCEAPAADTAGWRVVEHGEFVFRVPPDFERMPVQPFDSDVDQWGTGPRRFVMYDLGWYSSDLQEAARLAGYKSCTMHIGDHPAFVVAGWDSAGTWAAVGPKVVVAATWRNLRGGGHLTLSATSDRRNEYGTLVSIVRSVRFKPR